MSRPLLALLCLLTAPLVSGCGDKPTALAGEARFEARLRLESTSVVAGEPLRFELWVENVGTGVGSLGFVSGCHTTYQVSDATGVVFDLNWIIGLCTAEARSIELRPGESHTWAGAWTQETATGPAAPGSYRLTVNLLSSPPQAAEAEFAITP